MLYPKEYLNAARYRKIHYYTDYHLKYREENQFPHPPLHRGQGRVVFSSIVMLEQITTIDKHHIKAYLCRFDDKEMRKIDHAIEISLGLRPISKHQSKESPSMKLTGGDRYNGSGCLDMTAYHAMKNIEREERRPAEKNHLDRERRGANDP